MFLLYMCMRYLLWRFKVGLFGIDGALFKGVTALMFLLIAVSVWLKAGVAGARRRFGA